MHGNYTMDRMNCSGAYAKQCFILRGPDGKVLLNSDGKTTRRFATAAVAKYYIDTDLAGQGYIIEPYTYM